MTETVRAALVAADRVDTYLGALALSLAGSLDSGRVTSPSAVAKELRATMSEALADVQTADEVDELLARRNRKVAGG